MYCVDFAENALFSSFGIICLQPLPSMLSDETSVDRMNDSGPTIFKIQSVYFQQKLLQNYCWQIVSEVLGVCPLLSEILK